MSSLTRPPVIPSRAAKLRVGHSPQATTSHPSSNTDVYLKPDKIHQQRSIDVDSLQLLNRIGIEPGIEHLPQDTASHPSSNTDVYLKPDKIHQRLASIDMDARQLLDRIGIDPRHYSNPPLFQSELL
jgi:hypothetical protein